MIRIVAVGRIKERYLQEGINEYLKRLKPFCKLEIVELKDEGLDKEADKLKSYENAFVLDAEGREYSSEEFACLVEKNDNMTFIIGGPNGVRNDLKKRAISLSRMTFTHEMARMFFLEQLYRAFMIINERKYHK